MNDNFINSLENHDMELLRRTEKSDLHNHATRGGNINNVIDNSIVIAPLPNKFSNLDAMQEWYSNNIKPYCIGQEGFIRRVRGAFLQAKNDGIKILSMSFGVGDKIHFNNNLKEYIDCIRSIEEEFISDFMFIPEVCFGRTDNIYPVQEVFEELLSYNYFMSIDLVGDDSLSVDNYKEIYRKAKNNGFILKAHVGEFSNAESIRVVTETLELDQVQHGIAAVESKEVMRWLGSNNIQLNICPTSNVILDRTKNYKTHPIGILYNYGIPVTINTDDMLIFNQSVSEEYMNIYESGILSAEELNDIRKTGLKN